MPRSTANPAFLASLTRTRKSAKDGFWYHATFENSASSSGSLLLPKAAMMTPDAPAGTGDGRPTVTYRAVRNAGPTQANSSSDAAPSTFDRYTHTPRAAEIA